MDRPMTYRAGIIGCGRIASTIEDEARKFPGFFLFPYTHAGAYERHPRTSLVAAADIDEQKLCDFGQRWEVNALYTDYREMLAAEQLDIVSIAALSRLHHEMTMEVARFAVGGILLEKPVAQSLEEADEMIAACNRAGIKTVVNHVRTFDPYSRAAKGLIEGGEIGELHSALCTWGDGLCFGGSHLFDLLRYMIGSDVAWVFCHLDDDRSSRDPGGDVYLVYKNGVRVHVHMPFPYVLSEPFVVTLIGSQGRIRMGTFEYQWWKTVKAHGIDVVSQHPFPGRNDGFSGMYNAVDQLIGAIERGERPVSTLEDGRAALEVIVAVLLSGQSGRPVSLPVTDTAFLAEALW